MDETIQITLTGGGPLDGEVQEWRRGELPADPGEWGTYMVVDGPKALARDPGARAVYEPEPGGDPRVWIWRGWVP